MCVCLIFCVVLIVMSVWEVAIEGGLLLINKTHFFVFAFYYFIVVVELLTEI